MNDGSQRSAEPFTPDDRVPAPESLPDSVAAFIETESLRREVDAWAKKHPAIPARLFKETDLGNADFFVAVFRDALRFDHTRKQFLIWCDHYWGPDLRGAVAAGAQAAARMRLLEAAAMPQGKGRSDSTTLQKEQALKWAYQSESKYRIDAALELAKVNPQIAVATAEGWDSDPWLLGAPNGVIDLRTGLLRRGRQEDRITRIVGLPFDPDAVCPRFEQFLSELFNGDEELIAYVRRAIGYTLTGLVIEDCWFGCYGTGRNGKSTLFKVLLAILGMYAYTASFSLVERGRGESKRDFDIAYLQHMRFVMASETREGGTWDEERLKRLTGRDSLHGELKYGAEFDFLPSHKLWFMFNHQPRTQDHSIGFWRRVRLIPFTQQFAGDKDDKQLDSKLAQEYPGILTWAVRACVEWQREGLHPPQAVLDASKQYEQDEDPIRGFIQKHIKTDGEGFRLKDAYFWYLDWCKTEYISKPLGKHRFSALLEERLKPSGVSRKEKDGSPYFKPGTCAHQCTCMASPCKCVP